jgi:hypothetical protein
MFRGPWLITGTVIGAGFGLLVGGASQGAAEGIAEVEFFGTGLLCSVVGFVLGLVLDRIGNRDRRDGYERSTISSH